MGGADNRSSSLRRDVAARLAAAREQAGKAQEALDVASRARLAEIEKLATREQLRALDDPTLMPSERARLRRSLEVAFPLSGKRVRLPSGRRLRRFASRSLRFALSTQGLLSISLGGAWLTLTISNTRPLAVITQPGLSGISMRDGSTIVVSLVPNVAYPVLGRDTNGTVLGLWQPKFGYLPFRVPNEAVRPYR